MSGRSIELLDGQTERDITYNVTLMKNKAGNSKMIF
jgi:hypothetical protein